MAKKKTAKGKFKCPRCDRTFSMAAHLARHKNAVHGSKAKKKGTKKKAARRRKTAKRRTVRRNRRAQGIVAQTKLRSMTLEQLSQLIAAARAEAKRKLAELSKALK
jgi:uncharacterized C2H2 Zn-finger protein